MSDDDGEDQVRFFYIYFGQEGRFVPRDVTHVRVHPSIRYITRHAFDGRDGLTTVDLGEKLEEIGVLAFRACTLLREIRIPNAVKKIGRSAFNRCSQLTRVILGEGLEEIQRGAFAACMSLPEIVIPNSVRVIQAGAFYLCLQLRSVILGDGLEEICFYAFYNCTSLRRIVIPRTVKVIDDTAFNNCSQLTSVVFCNEIEDLVTTASMRYWWNNGTHEKSISTYCFLVRSDVPERLGRVRQIKWQANIHKMLKRIPSITDEHRVAYFNSIESKLTLYENLDDAPFLLELAIWKAKIMERFDKNKYALVGCTKMECRTDAISMVAIIVPHVLSFLTDGDECNDVTGNDGDHYSCDDNDDGDDNEENDNGEVNDDYVDEDGKGEINHRIRRRLG